ncbi:ribonuclease H-like domain-containing protein [Paenibacillus chartarius]|uniref:Ribonuclease H-like domain-containing protein n=1 Tax=Paenibacillus chartarius TaxID=747481 RepID=A0ABV6DPW6_9BACL
MSGLKERLQRLKGTPQNGASAGAGGSSERAGAAGAGHPQAVVESGWERLGGVRTESNAVGSFLLRECIYDAEYRHGDCTLGDLEDLAGALSPLSAGAAPAGRQASGRRRKRTAKKGAADADGMLSGAESGAESEIGVELEKLLFFDTETTGLGIGAGNVPFMIGLGFFREGRFTVRQLFIRNPAEEAAMLAYFEELLLGFDHIVSYNGRSFDWPILQSRFVLARRKADTGRCRHIDLLYPARSLWKTSLPSCRLAVVEEGKLGFRRKDDVPGSMAPILYVQYLAERDPSVMHGVFVHNEHDIVSLAALSVVVAKLLSGPEPADGLGDEELLRASLWLDKLGRPELADKARAGLAGRLLEGGVRPGRDRLLLELAAAYKKSGAYDAAAELWRTYVAERGGSFACAVEPYIELAMHCEHRERKHDDALRYAEEALNRVWKRMSLSRVDDRQRELVESLQQRIRRLQGKLRRGAEREGHGACRPTGSADVKAFILHSEAQPLASSRRPGAPRTKRMPPQYVWESLV